MTTVCLLELNDETFVVSSFRNAADRALHLVAPELKSKIGSIDEFDGLASRDLCGSYLHRVRYAVERSENIHAEIIAHDTETRFVDVPTARWNYDFKHTVDPAYEIQAALYRVSEGLVDVETAAQTIYERVDADIFDLRGRGHSDLAIMVAYADLEDLMNSTFMILPRIGDAKEVIDGLPEVAKSQFLEMATKAFPDKVTEVSSLRM